MLVRDSDLTSYARIRNAALEGFAATGVEGTSIRDVARAAGVSPGLVQHHFPTKAALRDAVNEYVIETAREVWSKLDEIEDADDRLERGGEQIFEFARQHPAALLYVARSASQRDEAALSLFDGFVEITEEQLGRLARDKLLHKDLDVKWTALQLVVLLLGSVLFEPALNRHLREPLTTPKGLKRWNEAATDLLRRGAVRPEVAKR